MSFMVAIGMCRFVHRISFMHRFMHRCTSIEANGPRTNSLRTIQVDDYGVDASNASYNEGKGGDSCPHDDNFDVNHRIMTTVATCGVVVN